MEICTNCSGWVYSLYWWSRVFNPITLTVSWKNRAVYRFSFRTSGHWYMCAHACATTDEGAWWPSPVVVAVHCQMMRKKRAEWFPAALWKIPALFSLALNPVCLANYSSSPPMMPSHIWCFLRLFLLLFPNPNGLPAERSSPRGGSLFFVIQSAPSAVLCS